MAYYLPQDSTTGRSESTQSPDSTPSQPAGHANMADLKVFWGPEICRIEYLMHLLNTGRITDPYWACHARP